MRKSEYKVDIICPFNICQLNHVWNKMGSMCLHCDYSELRNENVTNPVVLDENSNEVNDFKESIHSIIMIKKEL